MEGVEGIDVPRRASEEDAERFHVKQGDLIWPASCTVEMAAAWLLNEVENLRAVIREYHAPPPRPPLPRHQERSLDRALERVDG